MQGRLNMPSLEQIAMYRGTRYYDGSSLKNIPIPGHGNGVLNCTPYLNLWKGKEMRYFTRKKCWRDSNPMEIINVHSKGPYHSLAVVKSLNSAIMKLLSSNCLFNENHTISWNWKLGLKALQKVCSFVQWLTKSQLSRRLAWSQETKRLWFQNIQL